MKNKPAILLLLISALLAVYYLVCGIFLNQAGYLDQEALFYIEKTRIVMEGTGNRINVMGLTAPIVPFYISLIFSRFNMLLGPVIASAICTAALFHIIAGTVLKSVKDNFYLLVLLVTFIFHPGILYVACSGKSTALILIFFFLFFYNLIRFYRSNTTFHVSLASICLVVLIFCDYKFIWLTLFFIPLVLSITLQSLNLGEKESVFRLFLSFNNPSLRRKLINKTFALYIILFILPLAGIVCYKMLALSHANDVNYTTDSPYATWTVLADKISFDQVSAGKTYILPEDTVLLSVKIILFCPMILIAIYLFRKSLYQMLTIITPFAFIEFLHVKYDKVFLSYEYYIMFLILALLCIFYQANNVAHKAIFKISIGVVTLVQLYTGFIYLKNSPFNTESNFITMLLYRAVDAGQNENRDLANFLNRLPDNTHVLMDDAIAFPVVAFTNNIHKLILPYQTDFLSAIESPDKYAGYLLVATDKNQVYTYSQLNSNYLPIIKRANSALRLHRVYETDDWVLYKINVN